MAGYFSQFICNSFNESKLANNLPKLQWMGVLSERCSWPVGLRCTRRRYVARGQHCTNNNPLFRAFRPHVNKTAHQFTNQLCTHSLAFVISFHSNVCLAFFSFEFDLIEMSWMNGILQSHRPLLPSTIGSCGHLAAGMWHSPVPSCPTGRLSSRGTKYARVSLK